MRAVQYILGLQQREYCLAAESGHPICFPTKVDSHQPIQSADFSWIFERTFASSARILELDRHAELLSAGGEYARLSRHFMLTG